MQVRTGITVPEQALAVADAAVHANGESITAGTNPAGFADAYRAFTEVPGGYQPPVPIDIPYVGGTVPAMGTRRGRRSADALLPTTEASGADRGPRVPASAADPTVANTASAPVASPASSGFTAGVPVPADFATALFAQFRKSPLHTWQRADLIEQVFNEWKSEGPSPRSAERLRDLSQPGDADGAAQAQGAIILDAMVLHLIDRGRYAPLVRDYIDLLKRSGDHAALVDALIQDHPGQSREWAATMVETALFIWNEPLPPELRGENDTPDRPAFDIDARILKLHRIMNADTHVNGDEDDSSEQSAMSDAATPS